MFYSRFILLLSLSYTDHLVSIVPFIYDYLNFTTILLCLCFYSLFYHFVNLTFICNNNNLYIRLSFHCTYDTDEEIRDFEIYLSVILNNVILMLLFPHIFQWFFDIYIYIYIYIRNKSCDIPTNSFFPKMHVSECLTLNSWINAHRIGFLGSINDNLTNTSSTPPPEVKK